MPGFKACFEMPKPNLSLLRLARTVDFAEYQANTSLFGELPNRQFAQGIRDGVKKFTSSPMPYVLYHAWKPNFVLITSKEAKRVTELARASARRIPASLLRILEENGWNETEEDSVDLSLLLRRTSTSFPAMQNPHELRRFLKIVLGRQPRAVLEIGTARGGMLYALAQVSHPEATLIGVDLPGGPGGGGQTDGERRFYSGFGYPGQSIRVLPGDSRGVSTQKAVTKALKGRKLDLLFIDGDHSFEAVKSDFDIYRQYVSANGLIAFHDIRYDDVRRFWKSLVTDYPRNRTVTIVDRKRSKSAWGIGLLYP